MKHLSDQDLITQYLETEDQTISAELFTRHSDMIYRSALRIMKNSSDAEDIMQIVYYKLMNKLSSYSRTGSFIGWLLQITIHTCYDQLKMEKNRLKREKVAMSKREQFYEQPNNDVKEIVDLYLQKLPDRYRMPIVLRIMEGLSIKEVSDALEIPEKTIHSQISRGLEKLRLSLESVGFTFSVTGICALMEAMPKPLAPASIKSHEFFRQAAERGASYSGKISIVAKKAAVPLIQKMVWVMGVLAAAGVTLVTYNASHKNTVVEKQSPITEVAKVSTPQTNPQQFLKRSYDFDQKDNYDDLYTVYGKIEVIPNKGVQGSSCSLFHKESVLAVDFSRYQLPVKISFVKKVNLVGRDDKFGLFIFKYPAKSQSPILDFSNMGKSKAPRRSKDPQDPYEEAWSRHTLYVSKEGVQSWFDDSLNCVTLMESEKNDKLYIDTNDEMLLDNLVIESIRPEDLPSISPFIDFLKNTPVPANMKDSYSLDLTPYKGVLPIERAKSVAAPPRFLFTTSVKFNKEFSLYSSKHEKFSK